MAYTKTNWVDDVTPVSALNMNNLETQYDEAVASDVFQKIAEINVTTAVAQVDFTSISTTYKDLKIIYTAGASVSYKTNMSIRFNGDTSASYIITRLTVSSSAAVTNSPSAENAISFFALPYNVGEFSNGVFDISNTQTKMKNVRIFCTNPQTGGLPTVVTAGAQWQNTINNVTSISLIAQSGSNFAVGSRFVLLGVK